MQTSPFIGFISPKPLLAGGFHFPEISTENDQRMIEGRSAHLFYKIHISFCNANVCSFETEALIIICIGYSFLEKELAKKLSTLYLSKGIDALRASVDYFNFIIIDKANDRFYSSCGIGGLCPLYYSTDFSNQTLIFSNSLKGIINNSLEKPQLNYKVIYELFNLGMINPPQTLIENIFSVPSTKYLSFSQVTKIENFTPPSPVKDFIEEEFYHELQKSILPLCEEPAVGVMCSGGLDSTIIASLLRKKSSCAMNLYTVAYNENHTDVINTQKISKDSGAKTHYFYPRTEQLFRAIAESLWLAESEAVGTLSFNIALEFLFSEFISQFQQSVVVTGDTYFLKTEANSTLQANKKKYGLLSGLRSSLASNLPNRCNQYGYLDYLYQYHENKELFFPEVLSIRLTSKVRMQVLGGQKHYLPFLRPGFLHYLDSLSPTSPQLDYRNELKIVANKYQIIPDSFLNTKKTWMPGWLEDGRNQEIVNLFINTCLSKDSLAIELFGYDFILQERNNNNIRFLVALFYLELFYTNFIKSPDNLFSKDNFITSNINKMNLGYSINRGRNKTFAYHEIS